MEKRKKTFSEFWEDYWKECKIEYKSAGISVWDMSNEEYNRIYEQARQIYNSKYKGGK